MLLAPSGCQFSAARFRGTAGGLLVLVVTIVPVLAQPAKPAEEAAALARRTLASSLSVPIALVQVVSVSPTQWRDSSLGCPERGMSYTPSLVSGYKVTLRETREHVVHVAGSRAVICSSRDAAKLSPAPLVAASLKAADDVRRAVAERLHIDPTRVRIVSTRPARSGSQPCDAASSNSPTGAAFVVDAEAERRSFRYYTDSATTVSCEEGNRTVR
jgi:hypothetical protein